MTGLVPEGALAQLHPRTADERRRPDRLTHKVAETLAQEILRDVAARGLEPGDRLPSERDMSLQYGVARSSAREGLRILEVLGLVEIRTGAGGGPSVRRVDVADLARTAGFYFQASGMTMRELVQARLELEPVLAANAARRCDPALVAQLAAANRWAEASVGAPNDEWMSASFELHRIVASNSGNRVLDLMVGALTELYTVRLWQAAVPLSERRDVCDVHQWIVAAIGAGDAVRAEALMRAHVADYASHLAARHPELIETAIEWADGALPREEEVRCT